MHRTTIHAHAQRQRPSRREPPPADDLAETITATAAAVLAIGKAVESIEAGLVSQLGVLDTLLEAAHSRQAPWLRPLSARIAQGKGGS